MTGLRLTQYVYFAIGSEEVTAAEVSEAVGLAADRVLVRGSKHLYPPIPVAHSWSIVCDDPSLGVGAQLADVLRRVKPLEQALTNLVSTGRCSAVLQIVRILSEGDADSSSEAGLVEHPELIGFHLAESDLAFLSRVGASFGADEII